MWYDKYITYLLLKYHKYIIYVILKLKLITIS